MHNDNQAEASAFLTHRVRLHPGFSQGLHCPLSPTVCLEVAVYIGLAHCYLGTIKDSQLIVYDLTARSKQISVPSISFSLFGSLQAMLTCDTMIVVGAGPANRLVSCIRIWTGTITTEAETKESRSWAGLLVYQHSVWVFGDGHIKRPLKSVES